MKLPGHEHWNYCKTCLREWADLCDCQCKGRANHLDAYSRSLRLNAPKSEVWWYNLYKEQSLPTDKYNFPLGRKIPDVVNFVHGYVIEVDGSDHAGMRRKYADVSKDIFLLKKRWETAYDMDSAQKALARLAELQARLPALPVRVPKPPRRHKKITRRLNGPKPLPAPLIPLEEKVCKCGAKIWQHGVCKACASRAVIRRRS